MIVLIVDDQTSVLEGIKNGVNFESLGIDTVLTANSASKAKITLSYYPVDIMLCDIEMPGEDGLELNQTVSKRWPNIVRILISSHANFSYAQKSLQLGCFDYIVQPAPYEEIEYSLRRAINKIQQEEHQKKLGDLGRIYKEHESELSDRVVLGLFSNNSVDNQRSLALINQMGHSLSKESPIQLILFDIVAYYTDTMPQLSGPLLRSIITDIFSNNSSFNGNSIFITQNKYKQFVVLVTLNGPDNEDDFFSYQDIFEHMCQRLSTPFSCYVGKKVTLSDIRSSIYEIQEYVLNNVCQTPGLYYVNQTSLTHDYPDYSEFINRWDKMLSANQFSLLETSIISYIDFLKDANKANFKSLCDFHQQITNLIFNYAYMQKIDVMSLFQDELTYAEYLESYKTVSSLCSAIHYIIQKLITVSQTPSTLNEVQKAKQYIMDNISQNLTVKDVADYVHLSPEYFTKLFKKETGQNIKKYITQVKLDIIKDLLGNPNIPISLVALDLGYTNFSHFTQMFKKSENITPSEYRKQILGSASNSSED